MRYQSDVERLQTNAARCRELAEQASDEEAADALRQLAAEMDAAILIFEESLDLRTGTSG